MKIIDRKFLNVSTRTCHAGTIAFHNNEAVFGWFGGKQEGLPDSSIYIQYKDEVKSLGKRILAAYWNPILFTIEDELFLAYKVGKFCDSWQTFILNITDIENIEDLNKVERQIIPAGLNFCVKTKPIEKDGLIYCGSSVETSFDWTSFIETYRYKDDKFEHVSRSRPLTVEKNAYEYESIYYGQVRTLTQGIIQPSLWKDDKGKLHAFFRSSRGLEKTYYSCYQIDYYENYGGKWTSPVPTRFPNPNSGIDTLYKNGRLFFVCNPNKTYRYPLVLKELDDDFNDIEDLTIQEKVSTEDDTLSSELSYPYMVENNDKIHLVYTYGRSKIEYLTIET